MIPAMGQGAPPPSIRMRTGSLAALDLARVFLLLRVALKLIFHIAMARLRPAHSGKVPLLIRLSLERLGVSYLKLGQYLATRFDLLPAEIYRELTRLFEDVSPLSFQQVKTIVETELAGPLESRFSDFGVIPIASASVAQVHRAQTIAGDLVAVKIQRPGIGRLFDSDLRNLHRLAVFADRLSLFGTISVVEIVENFGRWTQRELDFRIEARTAGLMAKHTIPEEIVPRVFFELTTARVLTMEYVEGISLAKIAVLLEAGRIDLVRSRLPNLDFQLSGRNLAFGALRQLFVTGVFHGDPHPGNILIRDDNRVAFVDFGIFGELTAYERKALGGYIENIALGRIAECFRWFAKLTFPSHDTDLAKFEVEAKSVFQRWYDASQDPSSSLRERHLGRYTAEIFDVVRRNHVRMNMDTLLFWRTLNALDSSALRLSEHFDLLLQLRGFFREIRPSFEERVKQAMSGYVESPDAFQLLLAIPGRLNHALQSAAGGQMVLHGGLQPPRLAIRRANASAKRTAAALVAMSTLLLGLESKFFLGYIMVTVSLLIYAGGALRDA